MTRWCSVALRKRRRVAAVLACREGGIHDEGTIQIASWLYLSCGGRGDGRCAAAGSSPSHPVATAALYEHHRRQPAACGDCEAGHPGAEHGDVRPLWQFRQGVPAEHPGPASHRPCAVQRRRRPLHPVSARTTTARSALSADRLSAAEVRRTQLDGAAGDGGPAYRQAGEPVLARPDAGLPRATTGSARRGRSDGYAAGMARRGPQHPPGQRRLCRRELEPRRDHLRRGQGIHRQAGRS